MIQCKGRPDNHFIMSLVKIDQMQGAGEERTEQ